VAITISVGAAAAGAAVDGEVPWSTDGVVDAADRALYAAKRAGRNRVRLYQDVQSDDLGDEGPDAMRIAEALLVSASAREGGGEQHAILVSAVAAALAEQAQLSYEVVLRTRVAGLLHDIGKSAIPDRVLFKRAPLEADERGLLETHVAVGERMARRFPAVADAAPGIRHHHEHWDGSGYPDQLGGETIPIEARIVAVADAYAHAVGDDLPSNPAQRLAAAERLAEGAGTELDPTLVALLGGALENLRLRTPR
jgi:two-component system, cell cycle response regulator